MLISVCVLAAAAALFAVAPAAAEPASTAQEAAASNEAAVSTEAVGPSEKAVSSEGAISGEAPRTAIDFDQIFADIGAASTLDPEAAEAFRQKLYRDALQRINAITYAEWVSAKDQDAGRN
jgi:hypothetical protein